MTGFIIPTNDRFLLAVLNSKLTAYLMEIFAISRRGGYLEYKVQYLEKLPIKIVEQAVKDKIANKVESLLGFVEQLSEIKKHFWNVIKTYVSFEKAPKSDEFFNLDLSEILDNSKSIVDFSQREELTKFFNSEKEKALDLVQKIEDVDREVNDDIFDIYNLTPDERKYVISKL
jgi:hypothetical protein